MMDTTRQPPATTPGAVDGEGAGERSQRTGRSPAVRAGLFVAGAIVLLIKAKVANYSAHAAFENSSPVCAGASVGGLSTTEATVEISFGFA